MNGKKRPPTATGIMLRTIITIKIAIIIEILTANQCEAHAKAFEKSN